MATDVLRPDEVILNSVRYHLTGKVTPRLVSQQPQRMVTGSMEKANNPLTDSIILSSAQSGIMAEEYGADPMQVWWTNCDVRFANGITLAPLATSVALTSPSGIALKGANYNSKLYFAIGKDLYRLNAGGSTFTKIKTFTDTITDLIVSVGNLLYIFFADESPTYTATTISFEYIVNDHNYIHDSAAGLGSFATGDVVKVAGSTNNNGVWTISNAYSASQLNIGVGTPLTPESAGNYVTVSKIRPYQFMATNEVFTVTNKYNVMYGVHWDGKLFGISALGQLAYSAAPGVAAPSWTNKGLLDVGGKTIKGLTTYRDAGGAWVVYGILDNGLWVHDYATATWLQTEVTLPQHPNVGKGTTPWQLSLFVPAGTNLISYTSGSPAIINTRAGLDQFGALPTEFRGEIMGLAGGFTRMFAVVDASQTTGTGYSTVMAYNNLGWQPLWIDGTADQVIACPIVSSAYGYRLWWITNSATAYYIDLQRDASNPKKNAAYTYAATGYLVTPWYTGHWEGGISRALALKIECADMSADETIVVKYRINHATTAMDATWTTLGTISASGLTTYKFPSDSTPTGTVFRAIQFRFDLARKAATNTNSPVLRHVVFEFQKVIPTAWGWGFQIDCTDKYDNRTPAQMIDALATAAASTTLVPFVYDDETNYVEVVDVQGDRQTGEDRTGIFNVVVRAPQ